MKILYGTGNTAKLAEMKRRLESLDLEILGLHDMSVQAPDVPENGTTPLENARQKAEKYYEVYHMPVFSCDSGLYFDNVPESVQPGVHVRTVNGKYMHDEEMITYYASLAKEYGDLTARYKNAICLILDDDHKYEAMEPAMESKQFVITSRPHSIIKKGFPLDSLSKDIGSGKYYYDLPEDALDSSDREDGFLTFFKNHI